LRSFGKQWEAVLLTFLLMINNLDQKWEEEKNFCSVCRDEIILRSLN